MTRNLLIKLGVAVLSAATIALASPAFAAVNYPSGENLCGTVSGNEACYMIYRPVGGPASKKYIGIPEVRFFYNPLTGQMPFVSEAAPDMSTVTPYPTFNYNLGLPVGALVGDRRDNKIYVIEPEAADGDSGSGAGNFSYSNVFPQYIQSLSTSTLKSAVKSSRIHWLPSVDNIFGTLTDGNSLPSGTLVHQVGTADYYRITGYMQTDGRKQSKKQYIGSSELLNLWMRYTGFNVDADLSGYASAGSAQIPPGLLVRTVGNATVYFSDDNGNKQMIQSQADFNTLGFKPTDVHYVQQSTLDSTPSQTLTP